MPVDPDDFLPAYDDAQNPVILAGDAEMASLSDLLALAPELVQADNAAVLARAVNHLAHEQTFKVIEDPQDFRAWYLAKYTAKNPDTPWQDGQFQLRAYPLPQLEQIARPTVTGRHLVFYAVNTQIGTPYRVDADLDDASPIPDYSPVPSADDA